MTQDDLEAPDPTLAPVPREARIDALDYVRGLAVLGILLVNMPLYAMPLNVYFSAESYDLFSGPADRAALWCVRIVAESKFYTLFSFLFGVGFGVQLSRATRRGAPGFASFYRRRLWVLLLLGVLHLLLLWIGDVLHVYALVGFLLVLFRERAQKTVLTWALAITLVPVVGGTTFVTVMAFRDTPQKRAERLKERDERLARNRAEMPGIVRTYAQGTRREVQDLRTRQAVERLGGETGWGLIEVLPMFLLGLYVARSGVLESLSARAGLFRRLFWLGAVGVAGTLLLAVWRVAAGPLPPFRVMFAQQMLGHVVVRPLHALFYAAGLVLLLQHEAWRRRLAPLAAVGRMAATNYVMHTLVAVPIFYGVGFGLGGLGLFGRVGFAACLGLTVLVWAFQLALSPWWLARYRFGPLEWLWRSLTYGHAQPMRLAPRETPAAA